MELVYKELSLCSMKTPLDEINPINENQFLNIHNIYLGVKVQTQIEIPNIKQCKDLIKEFYSR